MNTNELSLKQKVVFYIMFPLWYVLSRLPLRLLYVLSSGLYLLVYHVVRYRRKLVRRNLRDSFPDKTERELCNIEKAYYQHFCDIFIESLKYFSISEDELRKRMRFIGADKIKESFRNGRSCGVFLGHYANWEWISSLPLWIERELGVCTQLYHPLENKVFDMLVGYTRERLGGKNIPVNESLRHLIKYKKEGTPFVLGFIADQVPFWNNIHYWTNFLNHADTPVFTGPERLMRKLDMVVYYMDVRKVGRGYYEAEFKFITDTPKAYKEYELTEIYTQMLEKTIAEAPAYWLWTHNRWKRTKDEWDKMYDNETGKVFMNKVD